MRAMLDDVPVWPFGTPLRILVVDDHDLFRSGLCRLLDEHEGLGVVGDARRGDEAVGRAAELRPDVVVMDINMPGMDGIEATRRILARQLETQVLIVTGSDARQDIDAARIAGAAGYVTKDRIAAELIRVIFDVTKSPPVP